MNPTTPTRLSLTDVRDDHRADDLKASTPWPVVAGVVAGMVGTAGMLLPGQSAGNLPGALVSSPLCGFIAAVGAWLVADSWIDSRRLGRARADASFVLTPSWESRLSNQLIARYVASSLASICGAAAAFSRLTPERIRDADIIALCWPLLAGVLIATIGAATSLTRNFQWAALMTPRDGSVDEIPDSGQNPVATIVQPVVLAGSSPAPDPIIDIFATPIASPPLPTSPSPTTTGPVPSVPQPDPGPPEGILTAPPDHSDNDDR